MRRYIDYVRKWPFYENCFFPCCEILPPGGYFELRTQHFLFGVGITGISILDADKNKMIFSEMWDSLLWEFGFDNVKIWYKDKKSGKAKHLVIKTPQALLIENVVERAIYLLKKRGQALLPIEVQERKKVKVSIKSNAGAKRFEDIRNKRESAALAVTGNKAVKDGVLIVAEE